MKTELNIKNIPWSEKNLKQKAATIGTFLGILLTCTLVAYAAVLLLGSRSGVISNKKGHTFEMELTGVNGGVAMVPGYEQNLSAIAVKNKSTTDQVYVFVSFNFNPAVYKITEVDDWELVEDNTEENHRNLVYAYCTSETMKPVAMNDSASFVGKLVCIAEGQTFLELTDDDFEVNVTGYAISTEISRSGYTEAWEDYQSGVKE